MELTSIFSSYVLTSFASATSGATLLGMGGYYLHEKYVIKHPLMRFLMKVAEKKFSTSSLVSYEKGQNGVHVFKLKIPDGYSVDDMLKLKPKIEDKFDCEIQVWAEETNFIIEMATNPLPKTLNFNPLEVKDILADYEFAMYLGKSRLGHMVFDFTSSATPHLLFGGSTGGGKSNLINQGLCGMLERYSPRELLLYLVDLKDGVELHQYKDVAHVKGFYENTYEADEGLQEILLEIKRRNILFKKQGVKFLWEYNQVAHQKLPRILILADEFAQFSNIAEKKERESVYKKWEEILQKGRSTGIHVMAGTQIADANVFPRQIKGNMDARFGFKVPDPQHSEMITGGSELTNLPEIKGRGIFKLGAKLIQTQTPLIQLEQMKETIRKNRVAPVNKEAEIIDMKVTPEVIKALPYIREVKEDSIEDLFMSEDSFLNQIPATN